MRALRRDLVAALTAMAVFTLVLGLGYPLLVTGVSQVVFPGAANGSLVHDASGRTIGSRLLGPGLQRPPAVLPVASVAVGLQRQRDVLLERRPERR